MTQKEFIKKLYEMVVKHPDAEIILETYDEGYEEGTYFYDVNSIDYTKILNYETKSGLIYTVDDVDIFIENFAHHFTEVPDTDPQKNEEDFAREFFEKNAKGCIVLRGTYQLYEKAKTHMQI